MSYHSDRSTLGLLGALKRQAVNLFLAAAGCIAMAGSATIPAPEKLLPDDTLVMVTAPDFVRLRELVRKLPLAQFWNDSSMKPFRDKFLTKWNEQLVQPLEHDLDIKIGDYTRLAQGQITLALTQNNWEGQDEQTPGLVLLLDARDKSGELAKALADLRKKWVAAGKTLRTEKIREIEFLVLPISTNDVPKTMRKFLPKTAETQEPGDDKEAKKPEQKNELVLGQYQSLLLAGNSVKALEKIVVHLTGGAVPTLGETAAYHADHLAMFRDAPVYGWVNLKVFIDLVSRAAAKKTDNPDAPNPFDLKPDKFIEALGLNSLKTAAFTYQQSNEGGLFQFFLGVPETRRQGIFKILAGEPKEFNAPRFVPADALKFQRWRIDAQKGWAALQKTVGDISPQWLSGINFLLDTANTAARDKDPGFDIRKNLIGNLGDDLVSYDKAPRGSTLNDLRSPPSLFLIGSPQPEQLAGSLRSVLVYLSQQAGTPPQEREFLGRKVYSIPLRPMGMPGSGDASSTPTTLTYAAGAGYLALSTDASLVEEYLRNSESQGKALRETTGLAEAAQRVTGPGTSLFGYQNDLESLRGFFGALRKSPASGSTGGSSLLPAPFGLAGGDEAIKQWVDFSLLPPFDQVAKYFSFSVYGGSATTEGLMFKVFNPLPPGLKSLDVMKKP